MCAKAQSRERNSVQCQALLGQMLRIVLRSSKTTTGESSIRALAGALNPERKKEKLNLLPSALKLLPSKAEALVIL